MNSDHSINIRSLYGFLSSPIVQASLVFVIVLSFTFSFFSSIFVGVLILISYLAGIVISNILWNKQQLCISSFITIQNYSVTYHRQQSASCTVCGDSYCKRQKSVKDNQPWLGLNIPKEIDQAIQDLLNKILNEFVTSWYTSFTKDEAFVLELRRCLRYACSILLKRALQVDVAEVITDRLVPIGFRHVHDFIQISEISSSENISTEAAAVRFLSNRLHPAANSRKDELQYLRTLCDNLSNYLLQPTQMQCPTFRVLIRELLSGWVLLPLSDTLCDPYCINSLLLLALSHEPLTQYPDTPPVQVQFLQRFVTPIKDANTKKSALQYDLSTILKDQRLLYTFMQFLKKEGAVHVLQFCLDVEEFNRKMLSPDLTQLDMDNLHREAWDLFSVYFKADSPDSIHFPKHVVQQMEQVLNGGAENITRLRTSTPLFQAYEVTYTLLEETYLPLFHQSDEFFPLICGNRLTPGFSKSGSNSPNIPGSPIRGRGKKSGEISAVAKLSSKFQKLLQFQAIDGRAFYSDAPLDLADTECTEDLQLGGQSDNTYRDMSAWRVTIPTVTTRQDSNSKPYPLFNIDIIDIGPKDREGELTKLRWGVERRLNDFYTLQAKLTEFHGDFGDGTQLPPKTGIFSPRGSEFLESRRQLFEEYLQKLLQKPNLRGSDLLHSFLNSPAEFSSCLTAPDGIGKMIRKSVEPIKLRKEKGQHLDNFLNSFLQSTETKKTGKYEWQDVTIEPPRRKRCITQSIFNNNFHQVLQIVDKSVNDNTETLSLSGPWDCILYVLSKLMGAILFVLQVAVTIRSLLGNSSDLVIKKYINNKLRSVLVPPRISHLVRLLQGALFNSSYTPGKQNPILLKNKVMAELERTTKNILIRWCIPKCHDGAEIIVETLQHPIVNKHLFYCLLDEVTKVLFPELATP